MSFEEYARHIKLKLGLATAVAVIKSKPHSLTIDEYIASLRNKLKSDDSMDVDLEISLRSDEFDLPDEDSHQNGECDQVLTQTEPPTRESIESPTILRDFQPDYLLLRNTDNRALTSYSNDDVLRLLDVMDTEVTNNAVAVDMPQNLLLLMGNPTQATSNDTQFTCLDKSMQMADQTSGIRENIAKQMADQTNGIRENIAKQMADQTNGIRENIAKLISDTVTVDNPATIDKNHLVTDVDNAQTLKESSGNTDGRSVTDKSDEGKNGKIEDTTQTQEIDTQETQIYSILDTQNTHFSQSQTEDSRFVVLDKYITSFGKPNKTTADINTGIPRETTAIGRETNSRDDNEFDDIINEQVYLDMDLEIGKLEKTKMATRNGQDTLNTHETSKHTTEIQAKGRENIPNASLNLQYSCRNDSEEELHDSQSETTIPFKIIEELNRVKSTLNRRYEMKTSTNSLSNDSGYRSDSQTKSSYKSVPGVQTRLQSSGAWLNQSAHALYDYLTNFPIAPTTAEITKEISQVLGDLVDRMHSEENYPSFLDEVMGSIDALLDHLSFGGCCGEFAMSEKDESIHRILLLNTSVHVITSTIEKITSKLELLHQNITKEAAIYELTDIRGVENTVYVFHILEVLLQRYARKKAVMSSQPGSQGSEEEKLPKRSSITDIWKQKWDPQFKRKDSVLNARADAKCLDTAIAEVLNKLVIDCMEGYSLISFAALQCFNVLQS